MLDFTLSGSTFPLKSDRAEQLKQGSFKEGLNLYRFQPFIIQSPTSLVKSSFQLGFSSSTITPNQHDGIKSMLPPRLASTDDAPTIYTSPPEKKDDKVFIDNFRHSDTIWPERIRNDLQFRLVDDDLQEAVASAALELDLASELGIDLNRTIAQLAITTMASCMAPSV